MPEYLLELYVSEVDMAAFERGAARARLGAVELTRDGTPVRYLRSIFVPVDETCFFLYEAESLDAVAEAAARAGLPFERIAAVIPEPQEGVMTGSRE